MIPRRMHYAWTVLAMGTAVVFGALGLARFGYTPLLPSMQTALGLHNAQAGVLASANLAGYLVLSVVGGVLAVRFGARRVIAIGLSVAAAGMLMTGLAVSFLDIVFWRAVTGMGSGASNVPVMALLAAWFAPQRRGLAAGIAVTGSSLALILLGPLVPRLLAAYGPGAWRQCWFLYAATTGILAALSLVLLRNRPADVGQDPLGSRVAGRGEPLSTTPVPQWSDVYRSPRIWHVGLVYLCFGFSYIIYMTFFTKYLITEADRFTPVSAGGLFMAMGWASLLCGLIWGWVSDRIGRKRTLLAVFLVQATSYALFTLRATHAPLVASAVLFGLTAWSIPAIMAALCGDLLGPRLAPAALGFVTLFFGIGQAMGPTLAGRLADLTGSLVPAFGLASVIATLGALGTLGMNPETTRTS